MALIPKGKESTTGSGALTMKELGNQVTSLKLLTIGLILVVVVLCASLWFAYFQMVNSTVESYNGVVKSFYSEIHSEQKEEIKDLELRIKRIEATYSALQSAR